MQPHRNTQIMVTKLIKVLLTTSNYHPFYTSGLALFNINKSHLTEHLITVMTQYTTTGLAWPGTPKPPICTIQPVNKHRL